MDRGQRDALYSNRTATGMMSIPNDYPGETMRLPCIALQKEIKDVGICLLDKERYILQVCRQP
jgi:hypothetical protein